jgi:hypothetical protein
MIASDSANCCVRAAMGRPVDHARHRRLGARRAPGGRLSIARYLAFPLGAAAGGTIVATIGSGCSSPA